MKTGVDKETKEIKLQAIPAVANYAVQAIFLISHTSFIENKNCFPYMFL